MPWIAKRQRQANNGLAFSRNTWLVLTHPQLGRASCRGYLWDTRQLTRSLFSACHSVAAVIIVDLAITGVCSKSPQNGRHQR